MTDEMAIAALQQHVESVSRWLAENGHAGADLHADVTSLTFRCLTYCPPEELDQGGLWLHCLESGELYHVSGNWIRRSPRRFHGAKLADLKVFEISLVAPPANRACTVTFWK
jgi:hypothetical protein